jgi:hypothetical protein
MNCAGWFILLWTCFSSYNSKSSLYYFIRVRPEVACVRKLIQLKQNARIVLLQFEAEINRRLHGDIPKVHRDEKPSLKSFSAICGGII